MDEKCEWCEITKDMNKKMFAHKKDKRAAPSNAALKTVGAAAAKAKKLPDQKLPECMEAARATYFKTLGIRESIWKQKLNEVA